MKPSFCNLSSVIIFQQKNRRYRPKRKNSKNDLPREVKKIPREGAKKLREGKFATSSNLCNDFLTVK